MRIFVAPVLSRCTHALGAYRGEYCYVNGADVRYWKGHVVAQLVEALRCKL